MLFAVVVLANIVIATKDVRQSPALIQRSMLQTSQNGSAAESEETQKKKKENSINVGMTLIVVGSVVIIVAGSMSVVQYKKQEAYK